MIETRDTPRNALVAVIFCAIIGIITYAGFGAARQKVWGVLAGSKMPAIPDETRQLLP